MKTWQDNYVGWDKRQLELEVVDLETELEEALADLKEAQDRAVDLRQKLTFVKRSIATKDKKDEE